MVKVVETSFKELNAGRTKDGAMIPRPRVRKLERGDVVVEYTPVDLGSENVGFQLLTAFKRGVRKARAENKVLLGSPDGLPRNG